jgi:hypothetical protein
MALAVLDLFSDLLNNASLVPRRPVGQGKVLCALIIMIHQISNIRYVEQFMKTLAGGDFIFVLSADRKSRALGAAPLRHFCSETAHRQCHRTKSQILVKHNLGLIIAPQILSMLPSQGHFTMAS